MPTPWSELFAEVSEESGHLPEKRQAEEKRLREVVGEEATDEEAGGRDQQARKESAGVKVGREHQALL